MREVHWASRYRVDAVKDFSKNAFHHSVHLIVGYNNDILATYKDIHGRIYLSIWRAIIIYGPSYLWSFIYVNIYDHKKKYFLEKY